ncbi:MAG: Hsp20/alpha crystallin family protein [Armatimonadia bacterium]
MTEQLDALLDLRRRLYRALESEAAGAGQAGMGFMPALDIVALGEGMVVTVELPGVARDDVNVELEGSTLSISGERKLREARFHRRERPAGRFQRSLALPEGNWDLSASLRDGVLTVRVKKAQAGEEKA